MICLPSSLGCFISFVNSREEIGAPHTTTMIHSHPRSALFTRPLHPFPFLSLCPTHWHIPSSVPHSLTNTSLWHSSLYIRLHIKPSKLFHTLQVPLKDQEPFCMSFLIPSLTCTVRGLCKMLLPLPQLWLTSESSSTCIRWFHMGSVCTEGEVEGHIHRGLFQPAPLLQLPMIPSLCLQSGAASLQCRFLTLVVN